MFLKKLGSLERSMLHIFFCLKLSDQLIWFPVTKKLFHPFKKHFEKYNRIFLRLLTLNWKYWGGKIYSGFWKRSNEGKQSFQRRETNLVPFKRCNYVGRPQRPQSNSKYSWAEGLKGLKIIENLWKMSSAEEDCSLELN